MVVKGIDISSQSNKITIKKLKENNIKYVMLRAGFTDYNKAKTKNIDSTFYKNYKFFKKNKFKIGIYYTFLATTKDQALEEVDYFLNIIKGKIFEYPVAIQIEDDHNTIIYYPENQKTIDKDLLVYIIDCIYEKLNKEGYDILIRTYEDWYYNIFEENNKYNYWIDNCNEESNKYLFYSKEDDIILNQEKDNIEISLKQNCFFKVIGNYIKAGYKILKSKIRKD